MAIPLPPQNTYSIIEGVDASSTSDLTSPPPLARTAPVPLPHQSPDIPVLTNPLITYHTAGRRLIYWDVSCPPSSAALATPLRDNDNSGWTGEPAVEPQSLTSIVVRVVGVERPIVVFPRPGGNYIMVIDVLNAVYGALYGDIVPALVCGASERVRYVPDVGAITEAIRQLLGDRVWWGGLCQSANERDVYILQLQSQSQ